MYFSKFDSYLKTLEQTKYFYVELTYIDGSKVYSSTFPQEMYKEVFEAIIDVHEVKGPWLMWNNAGNRVSVVSYEQIRSLDIVFKTGER